MPWIEVIPVSEARGELEGFYEKIKAERSGERGQSKRKPWGTYVSPPMLQSLKPKAMWYTNRLFVEIMRGESGLTPNQREMIATVTSTLLHCRY